ncbi:hypothetical protein WA538_003054 [Blastocystis sp. DL]
MCKSAGKSAVYTIFSIVGTVFMLFLYTIFKTNPTMYEEVKNPAKTCKGLLETAIAYLITALISGGFWMYHVNKDKNRVDSGETAFDISKKRFHFATAESDLKAPLLKEEHM